MSGEPLLLRARFHGMMPIIRKRQVTLSLSTTISVLAMGLVLLGVDASRAEEPVPVPEPAPRVEAEAAAETPVPKPRPEIDEPASDDASEADSADTADPMDDTGEDNQSNSAPSDAGKAEKGKDADAAKSEPKAEDRKVEVSPPEPVDSACVAELARLGTVFKPLDEIGGEGGCGIAHPFEISGFSGGIELKPAAKLDCATALALAEWVEAELKPAAQIAIETLSEDDKPGRKSVAAIRQASSYICRPRNSQTGAKLSEHGKGRAIDIAGFTLADGTGVTVTPREDDHTIAGALQAAVRKGACLHFTTVLGPGADSFHSDHIHLDLAERRGGYRICQ
ncbi:MAG: hypothetical protein CML29_17260 [Rhizobiales bacterium]|nr:hypothetical protein [Hyphomicrobiales bacterium]